METNSNLECNTFPTFGTSFIKFIYYHWTVYRKKKNTIFMSIFIKIMVLFDARKRKINIVGKILRVNNKYMEQIQVFLLSTALISPNKKNAVKSLK